MCECLLLLWAFCFCQPVKNDEDVGCGGGRGGWVVAGG